MAAAKQEKNLDKSRDLYAKLIQSIPGIDIKGNAMLYTSLNGNMFSFISKDGIAGIRLPKEEKEAFLKKYKTSLFVAYGAVLKEYVTVPDSLLKKTTELKKYIKISYDYVKTLKPKPSKKNKNSS